ncbi:Uncharacterized protein BP5553_09901 [Venustampulla echinocandica]|uniref:Glycosyl transferase CAP10 domain-containing protein n=1 Tax=Venustampulla echinocandica TaxID=2656787 RepID=A0A370TB15_9HELO|nr:Uncharacterized protein BP5553_09901 [Venustampulla echinocandica]RDL31112.1 Uncharacterized protein BP5553_09901 [Venustampulla echinocandica]
MAVRSRRLPQNYLLSPFKLFAARNPSEDTKNNLSLSELQCRATFPGLMQEIDQSVARGPFDLKKLADDYQGIVEGRIKDGKLYVISAEWRPSRMMLYERNAVLHQLHRALITSPTPLPDTVFSFSVIDNPRQNTWSFSRSNDPNIKGNYWVMPHFSFWSWPKPFIGTMDQALSKIDDVEKSIFWVEKINKVVWRGTAWFNSVGNLNLRPMLLQVTKGKEWADVQDMKWKTNGVMAENSIEVEDFCRYKYIIYTEGVTYSGRLPFHQSCASVIITPPLTYLLHTTHLLKPLFSSSLSISTSPPTPKDQQRWPNSYSPSEANIVFVKHDWSDLEQTIDWLRQNDHIAKGIADRQRELIAKKGYLSEGAEVCYWRELIRGWAGVVQEKNGTKGDKDVWGEGIRWETFSLIGETNWVRAQ